MSQVKPRMLFNGDLIYPKKGTRSPNPPKGYYADEKDAWVMHKIYRECIYRKTEMRLSQCGVKKFTYWCTKGEQSITTFIKCNECQQITEELPEYE